MAHFIGYLNGARGETSRLGTKNSGMHAEVRGCGVGGEVRIRFNEETGKDEVDFYLTSGSSGRNAARFIGTLTSDDLAKEISFKLKKVRKVVCDG